MGDEQIDYWFGDGDGNVTRWSSPAQNGAVLLDFDGDGRIDDAMLDLDGDGTADVAALDLDDDGVRETRFSDDGSGRWAQPVPAPDPGQDASADSATPPAATRPDTRPPCPIPGVARIEEPEPVDPAAARPGDPGGDPAVTVVPVPGEPGQPARQALADTDADGAPDVLLFDADGDGTADGAVDLAVR